MKKDEIEKAYEEKFGEPMPHKTMTEEEKKELYEEYKRVFNYDPDEEDVKKRYSDEFNEWIDNYKDK